MNIYNLINILFKLNRLKEELHSVEAENYLRNQFFPWHFFYNYERLWNRGFFTKSQTNLHFILINSNRDTYTCEVGYLYIFIPARQKQVAVASVL